MSFIPIIGVISALLALMMIFKEIRREGGLGTAGVVTLLLCIAPTMTIMIAALGGARAVIPDGDGGLTFIA